MSFAGYCRHSIHSSFIAGRESLCLAGFNCCFHPAPLKSREIGGKECSPQMNDSVTFGLHIEIESLVIQPSYWCIAQIPL